MFSERIKQLRIARGINQVELAGRLNVSKQCISNWENDNIQPSIEMLMKTARFFSVTTDYLLGLEEKRMLDISELTDSQAAHIQWIISDILESRGSAE